MGYALSPILSCCSLGTEMTRRDVGRSTSLGRIRLQIVMAAVAATSSPRPPINQNVLGFPRFSALASPRTAAINGELGVADRWWDLAVATWSLTWNLGPGWEDLFLERYGIDADPERIGYFRLMYDLTS